MTAHHFQIVIVPLLFFMANFMHPQNYR